MDKKNQEIILSSTEFPISSSKPGRKLLQTNLIELEKLVGCELRKPYFVTIEPGMVAGNHYHLFKREVFMVLSGDAVVKIVNPETNKEILKSLRNDGTALVIPHKFAHAVKNPSKDEKLVLMVWASHAAREKEDDFDYIVIEE